MNKTLANNKSAIYSSTKSRKYQSKTSSNKPKSLKGCLSKKAINKKRKQKRSFSQTKNSTKTSSDLAQILQPFVHEVDQSIYSDQEFSFVYDEKRLENEIIKVRYEQSSKPINICLNSKVF
mmetsp:Transcript_19112/g.16938  ORF Transcript_19112/g.16938 Transcript_19112/m.16938 type:complete len:121 (+) Transcript_19112:461-823(+)